MFQVGYCDVTLRLIINPLIIVSVTKYMKEISEVEGTVLFHVLNTQGVHGLKDLLKTLRGSVSNPHFTLSPFNVTLLLALSSLSPACEDDVINLLRAAFGRCLLEKDKMNKSCWLRTVCPPALDTDRLIKGVLENWLVLLLTERAKSPILPDREIFLSSDVCLYVWMSVPV